MNFIVNLNTKFYQNPFRNNADKPSKTLRQNRQIGGQTDKYRRTGTIYIRHFAVPFAEGPSKRCVKTYTDYLELKAYRLVKTSGLFNKITLFRKLN